MRVADWLSGLDHRLGFANRARLRRRRAHHLVPVTAEVSPLEDRCLLTSALLGSQTLVNATLAGTQQFATDGGRSIDVTSSGTVIAVWSSTAAHHSRIVARQIGPDGSPLSGEIPISRARKGVRGEAVVAVGASGQFVVAWVSKGNRQDPSGLGVFARVFSPDGTALTREFRVNASVLGNQHNPSVAWVSADRFVVAWDGAGKGRAQTVFARVFNASGTPVTKEVLVPRRVAGTKQDAVVDALANGGFVVA